MTGVAVLWSVDSWLTGFRYAGVLSVSTVVVVGSYLAGGVMATDIEYAADRNIAIAMYQDQLDVARKYIDSGRTLYTFESDDPTYYSLIVLPSGHDRFAGVRDTSDPADMIFFQSPRTEKNQQTGEPYDDNRGTCSKKDTATEPAAESVLPDDVPVVPSFLTCVPVLGHEAKVIVEERDGGNGIVLVRILENVDADHFFVVHVLLDPGTAPTDPAAYAKDVLDAVVVYDPDRVTAQELFDDAVAEYEQAVQD